MANWSSANPVACSAPYQFGRMGASGPSGVAAAALSDGSCPRLTVLATSARSRFLGKLLTALVTAGAGVRRFEIVVPTLHQIFVDRVGASASVAERRPEVA